jgi:hypothetical protein
MLRVLLFVIFALVALYAFGLTVVPDNCSQIGQCRQCWSTEQIELKSELCPNPAIECTASPAQQQHNAVVDALLCACENAKENGYADDKLNKEIEDVVAVLTNTAVAAKQVCDSPGLVLTKRQYS